jgi:hypothetical protein
MKALFPYVPDLRNSTALSKVSYACRSDAHKMKVNVKHRWNDTDIGKPKQSEINVA